MSRRCEVHNVEHREEVHPLAATNPAFAGRTHFYCPECRAEAKANVAETAALSDDDLKGAARAQLAAALKPMPIKPVKGLPGHSSHVLRNGVLVPRRGFPSGE